MLAFIIIARHTCQLRTQFAKEHLDLLADTSMFKAIQKYLNVKRFPLKKIFSLITDK